MSDFYTRDLHPGMGQAVAERTILRKKADGSLETWADVAERVALGNTLLGEGLPNHDAARIEAERVAMQKHLSKATLLMSGRHLQHGDADQPNRPQEVMTNCSTSATSFTLFMLLLNGSGVGRSYDDDMMLVNWDNAPNLRAVLDTAHPDFDWSQDESLRDARHKYRGENVHWHEVADTREGWAKAVELWEVMAFQKIHRDSTLVLDFSKVRPKGAPIMGMQGRPSSGPKPLMGALMKCATIKGSGMRPWRQAMYVDHYLAECVLVGGARRAARMAAKIWTDKDILEFVRVKRPVEFDGLTMDEVIDFRAKQGSPFTFLWSSNNSVMVDADFWQHVKAARGALAAGKQVAKASAKAWALANAIAESAYGDGTGEPGLINVDKLQQNDKGWGGLEDGGFVGSSRYAVEDDAKILLARLAKVVTNKQYRMIVNPCSEIVISSLGGYCVSGTTKILTREGYVSIEETLGREVEVFNGVEWSPVTPFQTGSNQPLLRVTTSDGSYIDVSYRHRFSVRGTRQGNAWYERNAEDLAPGDILPTFRVPPDITGQREDEAYTYGAFLGDGSIEARHDTGKKRYTLPLYEGKHHIPVSGSRGRQKNNTGIIVTMSHLDHSKLDSLKENSLPDWLFSMDKESTLNFIRGWLDTDGVYHKDVGGVSISTCEEDRARGLQLLLRRVGFSFAGLRKVADIGDMTNYGVRNRPLWVVYIPASEARLLNGYRVTTEYPLDLNKVVKQPRVVSVEKLPGLHDTFCFSEPKRHMGVFGNMLTYQCTIADVVPFHADTLDEAEDAFRVAARALIRVNTMDCLYRKEVKRTNRIGVGLTGVHEFAWKFFEVGFKDLVNPDFDGLANRGMDRDLGLPSLDIVLCQEPSIRAAAFWFTLSRFSRAVQEEAVAYSAELGVNAPHTVTTCKPSGTVSKLFGLTEGWHLPAMAHYMRWVQFRSDSPLIAQHRANGYRTRDLKTYQGTTIVGFPTLPAISELGLGDALVTAGEATPEDQYEWLRLGEKYWIVGVNGQGDPLHAPGQDVGSQISYTLKVDPNSVSFERFRDLLIEHQSSIRCCSVMPMTDTSAYEYQPEEALTKAAYEAAMREVQKQTAEDIGFEHVDCAAGACPIDFDRSSKAG